MSPCLASMVGCRFPGLNSHCRTMRACCRFETPSVSPQKVSRRGTTPTHRVAVRYELSHHGSASDREDPTAAADDVQARHADARQQRPPVQLRRAMPSGGEPSQIHLHKGSQAGSASRRKKDSAARMLRRAMLVQTALLIGACKEERRMGWPAGHPGGGPKCAGMIYDGAHYGMCMMLSLHRTQVYRVCTEQYEDHDPNLRVVGHEAAQGVGIRFESLPRQHVRYFRKQRLADAPPQVALRRTRRFASLRTMPRLRSRIEMAHSSAERRRMHGRCTIVAAPRRAACIRLQGTAALT